MNEYKKLIATTWKIQNKYPMYKFSMISLREDVEKIESRRVSQSNDKAKFKEDN